jgi:hypothetical protein
MAILISVLLALGSIVANGVNSSGGPSVAPSSAVVAPSGVNSGGPS